MVESRITCWTGNAIHIGPKISVDSLRQKYTIRAKFRSTGEEKSILYFGVVCYDENGKEIHSYETNRKSACTIVDVAENSLKTDIQPTDWFFGACAWHQKHIGFYFDGNTDRLPDFVWTRNKNDNSMESGIYSGFEQDNLKLNEKLPDSVLCRIQKGTTKICNHFSNGTYVYSAAARVTVPEKWTEYKAVMEEEGWNNDLTKFRIGTKYISVLVLANYEQNENAELEMKDVEFSLPLYSA